MKKCPSCDKTFEDSMRFCQVDGTPLVEDAPAFDPYATMVAPSIGSNAFASDDSADSEAATQIASFPVHEAPIAEPEDVLDIPAADPLKTMYVPDSEMRDALGAQHLSEEPIMEIPPIATPEPPAFLAPEITPPPSPFAAESSIPSPFDSPNPVVDVPPIETPSYSSPEPFSTAEPTYEPAEYKEPEPVFTSPVSSPFEQSATPAEWTPPPAPDAGWQNQAIGSNTPFQPPPGGAGTQSKGLAIGSLVCGILSCLCCVSIITGPIAIVLGFIAKKKIAEDPASYTGDGLAMGGMITGGVGTVIGLAAIIIQVFFGGLSMLAR